MNVKYIKIENCIKEHTKGITPQYIEHSDTIVLNQKCIRNNQIDYTLARYIHPKQNVSFNKYVQSGDLLINSTGQGTAGRCTYIDRLPKDKKVTVDSHILILRLCSSLMAKYISDFLFSNEDMIQGFLEGSSGQAELDRVRLFNLNVPLPQDGSIIKHSTVLSENVLNKITINNSINLELDQIIQSLYNYWFVQFDFPDANGNPYKSSGGRMVYSDKLNRDIPIDWTVNKLSELTTFSTESVNPFENPNKLFKHYSIPIFDKTQTYEEEYGRNILSNKFSVKDTDILVSKLNPRMNRVVWGQKSEDQICSTEFVVWRVKDRNIKSFLYVTAKSFSFINFCEKSSSGTSHSHSRVNPEIMMSYPQVYNEEMVQKFGEIVYPFISKYVNTIQQTQELTTLRNWLLPLFMNGQVTIKEIKNSSKRIIPLDAHILGGHIVQRLHGTKGMGRTKLQKSLHLIEYHCQLPLRSEASQFAAGPYDEEMMKYIDDKLKQYKQAQIRKTKINGKYHYEYTPTTMMQEVEQAYQTYSPDKKSEIDALLDKIACMDLSRAEIISTLYAVWNNRLLKKQEVTDALLLKDFYAWSKHKSDYPEEFVIKGLNYMRCENIIPLGWGRYIDKIKKS